MNPCCSIYMDSNATTPLDPEVLQVITSALETAWGNPSSTYETGQTLVCNINYNNYS